MKIIQHELNQNKIYILFHMFISILTMLPQYFYSPSLAHSILLTIILILLFLIPKFSKIIFSIFIIFLNISNIVIVHIAMHWSYSKADIGPRIEAAAVSPAYETIEYLSAYIDYKDLLIILYSLFVLFMLYKFLTHFTHSFKTLKLISISLFTIIIISVSFYKNPLKHGEPFSIPYKIIKIMNDNELVINRNEYLKSFDYTIIKNKHLMYDKIIVIMGEAVNKHHMKLYGYDKNTTPFLSSLNNTNNLYIFNAIAPTNQTRYSVPICLTKAHVHNFFDLYLHSTSIISDFKMHNYKTYWISNQAIIGKYNSTIFSMANESDIYMIENLNFSAKTAKPDKVLLEYLDKIEDTSNREMFLIHLQGSHNSYDKRYAKEAILYKNAKNISEQYDNTIYYTDYILNKIFNKFKDEKLLLIYVSDHGEVVSEDKHGHGYLPPFRDEYDIPLVIYSNIKNVRLEELYKKNRDTYFNTENLNYIVNYISGISDENNISFSNQVFALEPKNIFNYDELNNY